MDGFFLTFEGPDGAGKTTQMKMLGERLAGLKKIVVYTREPGGTSISEEIRKILLNPSNSKMVDRTEALLYAAARAQHVEEFIRPALAEGKIVLCDRFVDSTLAYQGFGRGIKLEFLRAVNEMAVAGVLPDLTVILDIDPVKGLTRITRDRNLQSGEERDRIELEHTGFHKRVREGFLSIARAEPRRCRVIDAGGDPKAVHEDIFRLVDEVLLK